MGYWLGIAFSVVLMVLAVGACVARLNGDD